MNPIKPDGGSRLGEDTVDNLLRVKLEAPPFEHWDATGALNLWWKDKTRRERINEPEPSSAPDQAKAREDMTETISLEDWE